MEYKTNKMECLVIPTKSLDRQDIDVVCASKALVWCVFVLRECATVLLAFPAAFNVHK